MLLFKKVSDDFIETIYLYFDIFLFLINLKIETVITFEISGFLKLSHDTISCYVHD